MYFARCSEIIFVNRLSKRSPLDSKLFFQSSLGVRAILPNGAPSCLRKKSLFEGRPRRSKQDVKNQNETLGTIFYDLSYQNDFNKKLKELKKMQYKGNTGLDWFHNLCMLLGADLSLIQRLVAKQCLSV